MVFNKLRSLLSHSRLPIRIASMRPRPRVYRVRIQQPEKGSYAWPLMSSFSLFLATKIALGDHDKTVFIPLSLSRVVDQPPYEGHDPVLEVYNQFNNDMDRQTEVKNRIADITVKAFEKEREKFGRDMRCSITWLWFQYPTNPPPQYEQYGLSISGNSIRFTTRTIHPLNFHRIMNIIWPEWMYTAIMESLQRIGTTIRDDVKSATTDEGGNGGEGQSGDKITTLIALPHPEYTGKVTFDETMGNFRKSLWKNQKLPPPPKGYVSVSGIIQIMGDKLLVHVDVDVSFDPETLDDFHFHQMYVRFVTSLAPTPDGEEDGGAYQEFEEDQMYEEEGEGMIVERHERRDGEYADKSEVFPRGAAPAANADGLMEEAKAVMQQQTAKARAETANRSTPALDESTAAGGDVAEGNLQAEAERILSAEETLQKRQAHDEASLNGEGKSGKARGSTHTAPPLSPATSAQQQQRRKSRTTPSPASSSERVDDGGSSSNGSSGTSASTTTATTTTPTTKP